MQFLQGISTFHCFRSSEMLPFVLSYCFSEMSPVCAVLGGVLGQEVVKVNNKTQACMLDILTLQKIVRTCQHGNGSDTRVVFWDLSTPGANF